LLLFWRRPLGKSDLQLQFVVLLSQEGVPEAVTNFAVGACLQGFHLLSHAPDFMQVFQRGLRSAAAD